MKLRDYLLILHLTLGSSKKEIFFYRKILDLYPNEKQLPLSKEEFTNLLLASGEYKKVDQIVINRYCQILDQFIFNYNDYQQMEFIAICDKEYPYQLKQIYEPPIVIFYQGNIDLCRKPMITIVGTREMTNYGQRILKRLIPELIERGLTVVSGLARGIDGFAHDQALKSNGNTIGVLGNGVDICYPAENALIQEEIKHRGLLLSEYFPGQRPAKFHFPARNRILAGISSTTLVIEAKEHSGSLITAAFAAQENRNVLAIPGNMDNLESRGTNKLISDGAKIVLNAEDIMEEIIYY
ncbi:DNA-processing protein DprA [Oenococcus alcoholitolerans]|uniref:DNA-processing protein DprA n=1 Tax=Oenococcus alcoholitolerans TaxID=931074 RepID=UPI003F7066D3